MIKFFEFVVELLFIIMSVIAMFMLLILLYPVAALRYRLQDLLARKYSKKN